MAEARRVIPDIDFNGKSAKKSLDGLTEQIEYDDVASGASDTLSIQVFNKDMKFLKGWLPKKGDRITASHRPPISGKGVYRKDLAQAIGEAFLQYSGSSLQIHAPAITLDASRITLATKSGSITVAEIINHIKG